MVADVCECVCGLRRNRRRAGEDRGDEFGDADARSKSDGDGCAHSGWRSTPARRCTAYVSRHGLVDEGFSGRLHHGGHRSRLQPLSSQVPDRWSASTRMSRRVSPSRSM